MFSRLAALLFLLVIYGVPLGQAGWELSRSNEVQALDVFGAVEQGQLDEFEDELRGASFLHLLGSPMYQLGLLRVFNQGSQKAVTGTDGWLYYGQDLDLVTAAGFLEERAADDSPLVTIVDFRDQLATQGVELLLVPVPSKSMANPEHISSWTKQLSWVENSDNGAFFAALDEAGVQVVDLAAIYARLEQEGQDLYLIRDTHWTPRTMAAVAEEISARTRELLGDEEGSGRTPHTTRLEQQRVSGAGDLVGMLQFPLGVEPYPPMELTTERVVDAYTGELLETDRDSEVLLLGDSFAGVFSDPQLGLGQGAGLSERLANELGFAVDAIVIAGGASRTVRESLARRAGGVSGKRVVIWQFSERDLLPGAGDWRSVTLPDPTDSSSGDPETKEPALSEAGLIVLAEVVEVSRIPEGFDYAFCLGVVEYRVLEVRRGAFGAEPLWVAHVIMVDFESSPDASIQVGDRFILDLERIEDHHDLDETSWVDDTDAGRDIWFPTGSRQAPR